MNCWSMHVMDSIESYSVLDNPTAETRSNWTHVFMHFCCLVKETSKTSKKRVVYQMNGNDDWDFVALYSQTYIYMMFLWYISGIFLY